MFGAVARREGPVGGGGGGGLEARYSGDVAPDGSNASANDMGADDFLWAMEKLVVQQCHPAAG